MGPCSEIIAHGQLKLKPASTKQVIYSFVSLGLHDKTAELEVQVILMEDVCFETPCNHSFVDTEIFKSIFSEYQNKFEKLVNFQEAVQRVREIFRYDPESEDKSEFQQKFLNETEDLCSKVCGGWKGPFLMLCILEKVVAELTQDSSEDQRHLWILDCVYWMVESFRVSLLDDWIQKHGGWESIAVQKIIHEPHVGDGETKGLNTLITEVWEDIEL